MEEDQELPAKVPGLLIVLVHGTFARNADWIRRNSKLCNKLAQRLPHARLTSFRWSGSNSHEDRYKAGAALARRFGRASRLLKHHAGDDCRVYLIGHSHGGNIILHALSDPELAKCAKGAAFLGTPFLSIEPGVLKRLAPPIIFLTTALLPFIVWMVSSIPILLMGFLFNNIEKLEQISTIFSYATFSILLLSLPVYYLLLRRRFHRWFADWLPRQLELGSARVADLVKVAPPSCPTFIATVKADEAGILLSTMDLLTLAPLRAYGLVAQSILAMIVAAYLMAFISIPIDPGLNEAAAIDLTWSIIIGLGLFTVIAALPLVLIASLIRGSRVAFGGETASMVAAARIAPRRWPDWKGRPGSERRTWSVRRGCRLRHSFFYADEEVLDAVSQWIAALEFRRRADETLPEPEDHEEIAFRPSVGWIFRIVPFLAVVTVYVVIWLIS